MTSFAHTVHIPARPDQIVTSTTIDEDVVVDHMTPGPDHVSLFTDRQDANPGAMTLLRVFAGTEQHDAYVHTDALRAIAAGIIAHADYLSATTGVHPEQLHQYGQVAQPEKLAE